MTKVAAGFGVTSTALKKTCKRHNIPTPERGYWAKLAHKKPVRQLSLPKVTDGRLDRVHIRGAPSSDLPEHVIKAGMDARDRMKNALPAPGDAAATYSPVREPPILSATRRTISKARPDTTGFASVQGPAIVSLRIAPASADRALQLLASLFALAETEGYRPMARETGIELATDDVSIAFGVDERPRKTPHEPTAAELERKQDNLRWGNSRDPWPKHDYSPSGRLAITIQANSWSGLRRTWSDGKTQKVETMLPEIVAGFAEHGALLRERQRAAEESERQRREAETRRKREEAFSAREKRRAQFIEVIHEQLLERSRLSAVSTHLQSHTADGGNRAKDIVAWIQRRIQQIDALTSPAFVDLSARSAKLGFVEPPCEPDTEGYYAYPSTPRLYLWSIDEEKELATSIDALEWTIQAGLIHNRSD
ncbi:hypothetical protein BjapCC829_19115 [Bradyrhizobium barranii]|uniref:Uncharacterized protein n=1 Tax=Bradyrhizobium barranii TaxID=2992140 RepID=A0ABY3QX19_9BRAD|nr:hypothetical protein [Bradyrhizobium japonicum]UFW90525.1 hypothetical protein BjapCC829_19115 [Bradyrhizobium japonicum]